MENLFKVTKSLQENIAQESFRRMPFVSFFLYMLMLFFAFAAFAELLVFNNVWINHHSYVVLDVWYWGFNFVEVIIGMLSAINAISILLILKSNRKGFYIITYSCVIALFILVLYSQYSNIEYNSIGNLILMKNLCIPFILWAVLNLKNDQGQSQWQYLK